MTPDLHNETKEVKEKPKRKKIMLLKNLQSIIDGTILTQGKVIKSLPFLFYVAFLGIIYIANSYFAEKKIMEIEKVKKELKELRSENIAIKSKLMLNSRQSEVLKRIIPYGIKESLLPPNKIFTNCDSFKNKDN